QTMDLLHLMPFGTILLSCKFFCWILYLDYSYFSVTHSFLEGTKNFGIVDVAGTQCHYIAFSDKTKEVHVWVTTGDTPLVKQYRIVDKTSKINAYKSTTIYWKGASTISPSDFVFTAPKDATEAFIE
ncbi:MAG: DUF2092 domain-containing protein, partial [Campylobacterota bacterium]|nr:DUF2092 domain-containing protein [Campylobacterota bacterium]